MKITVLDGGTLGKDIDFTPIERQGETEIFETTAPQQVAPRLEQSDVAVVNKIRLGEAQLQGAHRLKLICVAATGYDNIDTEYCKQRGIAVCNVPAYSTYSVAQLSVAMALSLAGHLGEYRQFVHSGAYSQSGIANRLTPVWHELKGQVWGVVGGGNIGGRVARIARELGCHVLMHRRKQDEEFETVDLDTLCRSADIISVHLPLSEQTRGIIDRRRIEMMKDTCIFINTARGAVTDEEALTEAIQTGRLGGLGVDVFSQEPMPSEHPFHRILSYPNVILTPHTAWGSFEARARCVQIMGENIAAFFVGENQNRVER